MVHTVRSTPATAREAPILSLSVPLLSKVRALGMAVPVYPTLGPLLNTVARMIEEVGGRGMSPTRIRPEVALSLGARTLQGVVQLGAAGSRCLLADGLTVRMRLVILPRPGPHTVSSRFTRIPRPGAGRPRTCLERASFRSSMSHCARVARMPRPAEPLYHVSPCRRWSRSCSPCSSS